MNGPSEQNLESDKEPTEEEHLNKLPFVQREKNNSVAMKTVQQTESKHSIWTCVKPT